MLSAHHRQTQEQGGDRLGLARTEWIPSRQNTSHALSGRSSHARLSLGAAHVNQTGWQKNRDSLTLSAPRDRRKDFGMDLGLEQNPVSRANEIDQQKNSRRKNQDGWLAPKTSAENEKPCLDLVKAHTSCKTDFFPLTSSKITIDTQRSLPSLPHLVGTKNLDLGSPNLF
jgi:hypothetical protein